ncbi:MAG TPA: hypothetical protein VFM94_11445 [Solirubrobacterales bacterium]|nr:hypothetical protein [Solirubrobacterales bacterium]
MSEQATPKNAQASHGGGEPDLRSEIARQQEEILRLRDLLVSKDAELGAAKGRLAELDDRSQRLAGAAGRIESRLPGVGKLIGTALRMLQTQWR